MLGRSGVLHLHQTHSLIPNILKPLSYDNNNSSKCKLFIVCQTPLKYFIHTELSLPSQQHSEIHTNTTPILQTGRKTKIQVVKPRFKPRPSGSTVCALPHYFMLQACVSITDKQHIPSQLPHLEDRITTVSVTLITHL